MASALVERNNDTHYKTLNSTYTDTYMYNGPVPVASKIEVRFH